MLEKKFTDLQRQLKQIHDLESAASVLVWDQATHMPDGGAVARGQQLATLKTLAHEMWTAPQLGKLLEDLRPHEEAQPASSFAASLIRVARREFERALSVPQDFVERFARHTSETYNAWTQARPANDFSRMIPLLEKTVELGLERASFAKGFSHPADVLIDLADEGMTVAKLKPLFTQLRAALVELIAQIEARGPVNDSCLKGHFAEERQFALARQVIEKIGYDFSRGRIDKTHHPFCIKFSNGDVRITTRVKEHDLSENLFSTIHEAGHAMYEQGVADELEGTLLAHGTSAGIHESQSRLWENLVGRSLPFWRHFYPELQKAFPDNFKKVPVEDFYRAINKMERQLIRTDADEVTYNLHVMIRFDLECALLERKLAVRDLAEAWRERYASDLGIRPPTDSDGVLQDVHWYADFIGGQFQCYTLGNIMAAQFFTAAKRAKPQIDHEIIEGNFSTLQGWLKHSLYRHGSKFSAEVVLKEATGSDLCLDPYLDYLRGKYLV